MWRLSLKSTADDKSPSWHPVTWAIIGFALGLALTAPFVFSRDPRVRFQGGAIFGGIPGAFAGLAFGVKRRRRTRGGSPIIETEPARHLE
jgi:multisubunit Na+/H+ antiporter MnhB subunit